MAPDEPRATRPALELGSTGARIRALLAVSVFALGVGLILSVAGGTLGYDYEAYVGAARRVLDGARLYDPGASVAGGFAIYLYPPPFALAMIPFALLPASLGLWAWEVALVAVFLLGVALMPVRRQVRWATVLLAGLQWPFLYTIKLGQVTPWLFLAFVVGWRGIGRPASLGLSVAAGALAKVQPALLLGWTLLTRRLRATAWGIVTIGLACAVSALILGVGAWADYVDLLRRVGEPVATPHNFTPGAIALQLGAGRELAGGIQVLAVGATLVVAAVACLRAPAETSYVVAIVASQLISPLLWDHYAMLLLIPTAFLLERGQRWAVILPLAGWLPAPVYPVLFGVGLLAPLVAGDGRPVARPAASA